MAEKRMSLKEAVGRFVEDGQMVVFGGLSFMQSYAFAHELIRQGKRELTVVRGAGDVLVDMLIGGGCVRRVIASHVWNSIGPTPAHCFRRAVEKGVPHRVEMEDYSLGTLTLALMAGALDLPFIPCTPSEGTGQFLRRSFLGEDKYRVIPSPFTGDKTCVVAPIKPDVALIHVQRTDAEGNAQAWGGIADIKYSAHASRKILVSAEEIVPTEVIKESPNDTIIPSFRVSAVVEAPWGAHPSDMYRYYDRDLDFYRLYGQMTRDLEGTEAFLREWVYSVEDCPQYAARLGPVRLEKLAALYGRKRWY